MDSLNIYEYDELGMSVNPLHDVALTSPSLDEGSSPYGHGTESPFTPSPAMQRKLSWHAMSTSPRPGVMTQGGLWSSAASQRTGSLATVEHSPRGVLFATSPSPTRPAPSPKTTLHRSRDISPSSHGREGTATFERDPTLSPLAPEMADDTTGSDESNEIESDTVVSFSTTDEEDVNEFVEGRYRQPHTTSSSTKASPGFQTSSAPHGLPPIAPVAAHPYDVSASARPRSFSPPPPFPGQQVERALEFANMAQRERSPSPLSISERSQPPMQREVSPSPSAIQPGWSPRDRSGPPARASSSVSVSSVWDEPAVVGVVEYTPSPSRSSLPPSPHQPAPSTPNGIGDVQDTRAAAVTLPSPSPTAATPFFSLSPYRQRGSAALDEAELPKRQLLCRATVEIFPGQTDMVDLFEGDDAESCARAFVERHGLREAIALRPLVAFFAAQLQRYTRSAPRAEPVRTVPRLRYDRKPAVPQRIVSSAEEPSRAPMGGASTDLPVPPASGATAIAKSPRLSSRFSVHSPYSRGQHEEDEGASPSPVQPPARGRDLPRQTVPVRGVMGVKAATPMATLAGRAPSLSPREAPVRRVASTTRGRSRSAESQQSSRSTTATPLTRMAPRPTRASLLREEATRKAQEARAEGPFPESELAIADSRGRSRSQRQPRTAPGTERMCRQLSSSVRSNSARPLSRETSQAPTEASTKRKVERSVSGDAPHYAQTTASVRSHQRRPNGSSCVTRPATAPVPVPQPLKPAAKLEKHVTFHADVIRANSRSASRAPARSQPRTQQPQTSAADPPVRVRPVAAPLVQNKVLDTSGQRGRGQRSLFAHVDPNVMQVHQQKPARRPVSPISESAPAHSPVQMRVVTPAETEAVAEKARRWFTALGSAAVRGATSPTPMVSLDGSAAAPARAAAERREGALERGRRAPVPRSHLLSSLRTEEAVAIPVSARSASPASEQSVSSARAHSQLWHDMGLDRKIQVPSSSTPSLVKNFDMSSQSRPFYQPFIGR